MPKARQTAILKAYARGPWTPWDTVAVTDKMRAEYPLLAHCTNIWANNRFEVQAFSIKTAIGGMWQLGIIRHGDIDQIMWEELQRIVHDLFGPEVTAIEIFPPLEHEWEVKKNVRVLWVLPSTWPLPFGLQVKGSWGQPT